MSELEPLVIGDLVVEKPIIQGGMGVGISLHKLAGAVAKAGGMGIISAAQIGFREPDFTTNFVEANVRSIRREMRLAREIAPQGAIGFNIMVATKHYDMWVKEAVKAGADIIISGAGLPVSLPEYVEAAYAEMEEKPARRIKLAPIVSSAKSAMVICKMWDRKCHIAPDLVVVEGGPFDPETLYDRRRRKLRRGVIELPCRIGRNRHLAMGLFLHLLDKGFDTLCQGMVRWQMIGKLVLDLAALTACGCFLFAAPRKGCHQDRQTGCRHYFHHLPRFHRFPPCSTLARPLYTVSIVTT